MGIAMTRISEFNKYGASLRVYFSFVEQMIWLGMTIALLSVTCIYINYNGGYYNGTNINNKSDPARGSQELLGKANTVTISNFQGYTNMTLDSQALNWVEEM